MGEGVLEREYIHSSSSRLCVMAAPQLVRVNVEAGGSSSFPANISHCMVREVSFTAGTREDEIVRITAAKVLKQVERYCRYADSASPRSFAEAVNLTSVIKSLDVFPPNAFQRSTAISETLQPKRYAPPIRTMKTPPSQTGSLV